MTVYFLKVNKTFLTTDSNQNEYQKQMDFLFEVKHPVFTVKYFIYIISIYEVFLSGIHRYEFI